MLYVKRLFLIDSAEEKGQWLRRAKQQWGVDHPIAVRATDNTSQTLGSTVPKSLVYHPDQDSWCASWMEAIPGPISGPTENSNAAAEVTLVEPGQAGDPAEIDEASESPGPGEADDALAEAPTTEESDGNPPSVERSGEEAAEQGSEARAERATSPAATAMTPETALSVSAAADELIGIDVNVAFATGFLVLEIVTLSGAVRCTAIINIASVLHERPVEHFAVVLTPLLAEAMDDLAIHGVLEFTVIRSGYQAERGCTVRELVVFAPDTPLPTPVSHPCATFSTNHLYFATTFLTGTGAFIVSNVVCVECASDETVAVEFIVTGDSGLVKISPANATLSKKGDRQFFTFTWDMFKPFKLKPQEDATMPPVKVIALLRENGVNVPPVDFVIHAELPHPMDTNPPFLFWVNNTMVSNAPCSEAEVAAVRCQLPVYEIQKKITAGRDGGDEPTDKTSERKEGHRPWWKFI